MRVIYIRERRGSFVARGHDVFGRSGVLLGCFDPPFIFRKYFRSISEVGFFYPGVFVSRIAFPSN